MKSEPVSSASVTSPAYSRQASPVSAKESPKLQRDQPEESKAVSKSPKKSQSSKSRKREKAQTQASKSAPDSRDDSAGMDFSRALASLQSGNVEEARRALERLKKKTVQRGTVYQGAIVSLKIALDAQTERLRQRSRSPSAYTQELTESELTGLSIDQQA